MASDRYDPDGPLIRYPEPDVIALDKRFKYKLGNTPIMRLHRGTMWAEGPAWSGNGRFLVFNAGGLIYRMAADGSGEPQRIDTGSLGSANAGGASVPPCRRKRRRRKPAVSLPPTSESA